MCLPKYFLSFGSPKNCFLPLRNVQETAWTSKGSKRDRHVTSVRWLAKPSLSIQVIALCFGELSDVFDCKKGYHISKQIKILKMTDNPLYLPTFLQIIQRHVCQLTFGRPIARRLKQGNLRVYM